MANPPQSHPPSITSPPLVRRLVKPTSAKLPPHPVASHGPPSLLPNPSSAMHASFKSSISLSSGISSGSASAGKPGTGSASGQQPQAAWPCKRCPEPWPVFPSKSKLDQHGGRDHQTRINGKGGDGTYHLVVRQQPSDDFLCPICQSFRSRLPVTVRAHMSHCRSPTASAPSSGPASASAPPSTSTAPSPHPHLLIDPDLLSGASSASSSSSAMGDETEDGLKMDADTLRSIIALGCQLEDGSVVIMPGPQPHPSSRPAPYVHVNAEASSSRGRISNASEASVASPSHPSRQGADDAGGSPRKRTRRASTSGPNGTPGLIECTKCPTPYPTFDTERQRSRHVSKHHQLATKGPDVFGIIHHFERTEGQAFTCPTCSFFQSLRPDVFRGHVAKCRIRLVSPPPSGPAPAAASARPDHPTTKGDEPAKHGHDAQQHRLDENGSGGQPPGSLARSDGPPAKRARTASPSRGPTRPMAGTDAGRSFGGEDGPYGRHLDGSGTTHLEDQKLMEGIYLAVQGSSSSGQTLARPSQGSRASSETSDDEDDPDQSLPSLRESPVPSANAAASRTICTKCLPPQPVFETRSHYATHLRMEHQTRIKCKDFAGARVIVERDPETDEFTCPTCTDYTSCNPSSTRRHINLCDPDAPGKTSSRRSSTISSLPAPSAASHSVPPARPHDSPETSVNSNAPQPVAQPQPSPNSFVAPVAAVPPPSNVPFKGKGRASDPGASSPGFLASSDPSGTAAPAQIPVGDERKDELIRTLTATMHRQRADHQYALSLARAETTQVKAHLDAATAYGTSLQADIARLEAELAAERELHGGGSAFFGGGRA